MSFPDRRRLTRRRMPESIARLVLDHVRRVSTERIVHHASDDVALIMRTTLDLGDDVLITAKDIARREHRTAGEVITELARIGLRHTTKKRDVDPELALLGFEPIASNGSRATNEDVNRLREMHGD